MAIASMREGYFTTEDTLLFFGIEEVNGDIY